MSVPEAGNLLRDDASDCCQASPYLERPHFAGSSAHVEDLGGAARSAGARILDLRGSPHADVVAALQALAEEAVERRSQRTAVASDPRLVLVTDSVQLTSAEAAQRAGLIAAQVRFVGIHLWIQLSQPFPHVVELEIERSHCSRCTVRRMVTSFGAGEVL